jgi:DNA-binding Lrp family transcriptional regulator
MDQKKLKHDILGLLARNARMDNQEIADRLACDRECVEKLIREMETDRTILGYSVVADEEKLGEAPVRAIIEVEVLPERDGGFDNVASKISKFPEVHSVYLVSGRYDLRLEVTGESLQDVASFVASKLASQDGVKSTATHFLLKKYKEAGVQFHEDETYERLKIVP